MVAKYETTNDGGKCPLCDLRRRLAPGLMADAVNPQEVVDALLEAVEAVRAVDVADGDDEAELATYAAHELCVLVHTLHRIAEEGGE